MRTRWSVSIRQGYESRAPQRGAHRIAWLSSAAVYLLTAVCQVHAIDYGATGTIAGRSASGHVTGPDAFEEASGLVQSATTGGSIRFELCAGNEGCCCTDDVTACTDVVGTQDCGSLADHCDNDIDGCCHQAQTVDGNAHQSCCADNGGAQGICCSKGEPCTLGISFAGVCASASCSGSGDFMVHLCEDATVNALCGQAGQPACCPSAGARLDVTIGVGEGALELTKSELAAMADGLLEIYIQFTDLTVVRADIASKPVTVVPAVSEWGLAAMIALLLVAGTVVVRRHRLAAHV